MSWRKLTENEKLAVMHGAVGWWYLPWRLGDLGVGRDQFRVAEIPHFPLVMELPEGLPTIPGVCSTSLDDLAMALEAVEVSVPSPLLRL